MLRKITSLIQADFELGYGVITGLRERTEIENDDENAWTWRIFLQIEYIYLFSFPIFNLHGFCGWLWFPYR